MNWLENSIDAYYSWLKDHTSFRTDVESGWSLISTPFMGLFNDPIDIYVKQNGDSIMLSDDGITLSNLELLGVNVERSSKRKEWMESILLNYGVTLVNNELTLKASLANFPQQKHNLLSAISEISDMDMTAKHVVTSLFKEDVQHFLDNKNIIYTPQFIAKGAVGIDFTFDFQIAGRNSEIVLKSFNSLNKVNLPNFLFCWEDIKSTRERVTGKEFKSLAFINDVDKEIKQEYLDALKSKGADYILWSQKDDRANGEKLIA